MSSTTKAKRDRVSPWPVYIVHCADHSQYTGIAWDVARRFGALHKFFGAGVRFSFVLEKTI